MQIILTSYLVSCLISADLSEISYYIVSYLISADLPEKSNYLVSCQTSADLTEKSKVFLSLEVLKTRQRASKIQDVAHKKEIRSTKLIPWMHIPRFCISPPRMSH